MTLHPGEITVDIFAGGGGASTGIEAALGRPIDVAINHDPMALAVHAANHPHTRHMTENLWKTKPIDATGGRPVGLLWASPDCTHHSVAKGGKPLKKNIRSLAWVVIRWARDVQPRVIFLENVAEFRGWGPLDRNDRPIKARKGETFRRWVRQLERLGYVVDYRVLDASLFGAPTRRRRLFLIARRDGQPIVWPEPTHGPGRLPLRTAAECIDWDLACPSIFERKRPLAEKTMWRVAQGLRRFVFESASPFIVRYHGQSRPTEGARVESPADPLPTQTTENRFGLVVPSVVEMNANNQPRPVDAPLGTVTTQHKPVQSRVGGARPDVARRGEAGQGGAPRTAGPPDHRAAADAEQLQRLRRHGAGDRREGCSCRAAPRRPARGARVSTRSRAGIGWGRRPTACRARRRRWRPPTSGACTSDCLSATARAAACSSAAP